MVFSRQRLSKNIFCAQRSSTRKRANLTESRWGAGMVKRKRVVPSGLASRETRDSVGASVQVRRSVENSTQMVASSAALRVRKERAERSSTTENWNSELSVSA